MAQPNCRIDVRSPALWIHILDMRGVLTASAEKALSTAFMIARSRAKAIVLNFTQVQSIDSFGAGLLITMLARVRKRRLRLLAYGLSQQCRLALQATRLDEVLCLCADQAEAVGRSLSSAAGMGATDRAFEPRAAIKSEPLYNWADLAQRPSAPHVPKGAISVNMESRRPTGPVKGFGSLWRRTYTIRLANSSATPAEVIQVWKERFASFWPPSGRFYGADKPIGAGDVAILNLRGPAGLIIATGILVIYADDESFCFISTEGHMFGGMITFSAHAENGVTVAQVQALLRASDPLFEAAVWLGIATRPEDRFWHGVLNNLAAHFGVEGQSVQQEALLLDPRPQWGQVRNLWHNSAIRSGLSMPVRWLRGLGAR